MRSRRRRLITLLALWAMRPVLPAYAQSAAPDNERLFMYRGADREQRLLEAARREGALVLYTSLAPPESGPLTQAFGKKVRCQGGPVAVQQ